MRPVFAVWAILAIRHGCVQHLWAMWDAYLPICRLPTKTQTSSAACASLVGPVVLLLVVAIAW